MLLREGPLASSIGYTVSPRPTELQSNGLVQAKRTRLLSALIAIGIIACGPSLIYAQQGLHIVSSPFVNNSSLNGVAAISDKDIWAVGVVSGGNDLPFAEHFNGTNWSVISTPAVKQGAFFGVDGVGSNDVWAVGEQVVGNSSTTLIERWNGTSWSVVSGAKVPKGSFLNGVMAVASNDVWAVGNQPGSSSVFDSFIEHWNGTSWNLVSSPQFAGGSSLFGVAADSANDVWAVGNGNSAGLVEHWNGQSWSVVPSPSPAGNPNNAGSNLKAVTAFSPTNARAVVANRGPLPLISRQ
jgi:hypothetical protein